MDILTDWLREIVTSAVVVCRSRVSAPWGIAMSVRDGIMFHIVTDGACWLRRAGAAPVRLLQGDLVLMPHGLDHDLVDDPDGTAVPLDDFLARPSFPLSSNSITTLVCGVYLSDAKFTHPMLHALPPALHFPASAVQAKPALASALALLIAELEQPGPGSETIIQHLFDSLLVYILRAWAEDAEADRPGWISALKDPFLSKAMACIHAEPGKLWTVQSLADAAGLSRAAFARQFAQQVGEPPLTYLTRWRMIVAARLMLSTKASLAEVAQHVGYDSEFAFSRAFKRSRGIAPTPFRLSPCRRDTETARVRSLVALSERGERRT